MSAQRSGTIGVIGGGLGGLAAACTLAARGRRVVLFERNPWFGGKAAVLSRDGYRFDMGPTILTVPEVLRRIFEEANRDLRDELDLIRLDPQWRCFFDDGTRLDLLEDTTQMGASLDDFAPGKKLGDRYRRFMALSQRLHRISEQYFLWRPVGSISDTFKLSGTFKFSVLGDIMAMRMGRSVAGTVKRFLRDPRVSQMAEHFTQYVGSWPARAPAILCSIAHMQTADKVWYPRGGTRAVPEALTRLARELGVELRHENGIRRILHTDKIVTGVEALTGETVDLAGVISNADSVRTHRELLGDGAEDAFMKRRAYEPACSGVVLYLALDRRYDQLLHHCFVFSRDPHEEFTAIYRDGVPAPDPTCYLCAPSRTDKTVAPEGGEALYVLVHTPYLREGQDWRELFPGYRQTILDKLTRTAGLTDLDKHIVFEEALTPEDIHRRYSVLNGAIYGLASHGKWTGAFKPGNRSPDLKGLYLAGGSAHPGPGMPMALMSGWIAADALDNDGIVPR